MNPLTGPESRQNLLWLSVSLGFLVLLWLLTPVLTPFVAAFIIGYVLNPGVDWMHQRGLPRAVAVLLAMLSVFVIVTALALVVLPILASLPGLVIARARQSLTIGAADATVAREIGIPVNTPVGEVRRVLSGPDGVVIYLAEVTYRGDYIHLDMDLKP